MEKKTPGKITMFVGLGNPGKEFQNTYHNAGRMALEAIEEKFAGADADPKNGRERAAHKGLFEYVWHANTVFVFPLTFMNDSGLAVREAAKKFKAAARDVVVFQDESDLPVGAYKISVGRGSAGHRGAQSAMDALHAEDLTRVRIGIRDPREHARKKASAFVLKKISARDKKALQETFARIAEELLRRS